MKKIFRFIIINVFIIILLANFSYAANENNFTKRIVSVVYDDSWSMFNNGQDYAYANYALQNIIGYMNENDELHIVKMSDKTVYDTINVSSKDKKNQNIYEISKWNTGADETPFEAIETAVNCLKECKDKYGSSDNIEYWLLVLTDGDFEGMPTDVKEYFENAKSYMSDVKFESIYVFIGGKSNSRVKNVAMEMSNTTCITSSNNEDICRGLFEAAEKIYGRTTLKNVDFQKNGNEVKFKFPFPINKLIVYEQDQNIELKNVKTSKGTSLTTDTIYSANKYNKPALTSKIIEVKSNNDCIPAGDVTMIFDGEVDLDENKFQVMVDSAVTFELKIVDKDGIDIPNNKWNNFTDKDLPNFVVTPINPYDHTVINLSDFVSKCDAYYQYENNDTKLIYDTNDLNYKFNRNIHLGNNTFIAKLNLDGYFNTFSNTVNLYVGNSVPEPVYVTPSIMPEYIDINTNFTKNYEKVGSLNYNLANLTEKINGTLSFSNIPSGIQIKVNGNTVKKNKVSLTLNENNDVEIYCNKDYKETDSAYIVVNVDTNNKNVNLKDKGISFLLNPIIRNVKFESKQLIDDMDNLSSLNAYGKNLYELTPMINNINMSKDELKKCKISFENNGDKIKFKYKIDENQNKNVIYLSVKNPIFSFSDKNINAKLNMVTPYDEIITYPFSFQIKNNLFISIIKLLIPILLLIYIFGLIKKPRFETKKHKIAVFENGKEKYSGPIKVKGGLNYLVPFTALKGVAYDLNVKASDSKNAIYVCKNSLKGEVYYNNELYESKKDLKLGVDDFLEFREGRNYNRRYMYTDVTAESNNSGNPFGGSGGRGGRGGSNNNFNNPNNGSDGRKVERRGGGSSMGRGSISSTSNVSENNSSGGGVVRRGRR